MILQRLGNLIQFCDLFKVSATMLYKRNQIKSKLGGSISILAIILTILLCLKTLRQFFTFSKYSYQIQHQYNFPDTTLNLTPQLINFSISLINYAQSKRPFDLVFININTNTQQQTYQYYYPHICDFQDWRNKFGDKVFNSATFYDTISYCPPSNFNMSLSGSILTNNSRLTVALIRCYNIQCISDQQFKKLPPFYISFNYPQIKLKLNSKEVYQYILSDKIWFEVNPKDYKVRGQTIVFKEVQINDEHVHIWPDSLSSFFNNKNNINKLIQTQRFYSSDIVANQIFASFTVLKSQQKTIIQRRIIKLDQIISFIGGFFSVMMGLGQLFCITYNQRYLLMKLGSNIQFYSKQKQNQKALHQNFNIFQNIRLSLFWQCIEPKSEGNYGQKSKLLLRQMQARISVDNILDRLSKCQRQISRVIKNESWLKQEIKQQAINFQGKIYSSDEQQQQYQNQLTKQYLFNQSIPNQKNHFHFNQKKYIKSALTGLYLSNHQSSIQLYQSKHIHHSSWKILSDSNHFQFINNHLYLSVHQAIQGNILKITKQQSSLKKWQIMQYEGLVQIRLGYNRDTDLVLGINKGIPCLQVKQKDKMTQMWVLQN